MARSPHIVVLGAGSVGCFVGGAWAAQGLQVSFIGRDAIAAEVKAHGIRLTDLDGRQLAVPAQAATFSTKPAALAKADIVLLCVKSHATAAAAKQIALHAKRGPAVLSLQNGVSNVDLLRGALPKLEVVAGMVPFNIVRQGPAHWHKSVAGTLFAADHPVTRDLQARITSGPAQLNLAGDMAGLAWGKLLINLNNAVNALSGRTLLEQLKERDYRQVVAASILEALGVLKAAGIKPAQAGPIPPNLLPHAIGAPDFIFRNLLLRVQKIDATARSSMQDDLAAERPTEIDQLNGEVVRLADRLGMEAPVNRALVDLVRQREAGVEHLWSPSDLRRYVLDGYRGARGFGY